MFKRVLLLPLALILLLAALTGFLAINHVGSLAKTRFWVDHTHRVIETTEGLYGRLQDQETAQRGYLLSGDRGYLAASDAQAVAIPKDLAALRALVADNSAQVTRVDALSALIAARKAGADRANALMAAGDAQAARRDVTSGAAKVSMDRVRAAIDGLRQAEETLLTKRQAEADTREHRGFQAAVILSVLALLGLVASVLALGASNRRLTEEMHEREAAETARREGEALYGAIFANTADFLFVVNISPEGHFSLADINPAAEAATGLKAEQMRGRAIHELASGPVAERLVGYYRQVAEAGIPVFTRDQLGLPSGQRSWETVLVPVKGPSGRIERIVGSARDVTDREMAEEQMRRSQRMEAIGQLTGGVAHDFNNLLQVIRGNLEMVEPALVGNEKARQRLRNALHGADRAAQLTRQMLAFARRQPLEPKVVNLGRLVGDLAEMMRRTLGEGVEVETVIGGGLWNTLADPAQVESALLNLAINARDAMPEGGRLTIELSNASLDEAYASRDQEIAPGQYVLLAVSDTGQGMSKATIARVFEPFFTTKVDGKGTGLGLSMVYGFVKQSNGHVQIYSEPGEGTTVKIYLPRSRKLEEQTIPPTAATRGGGETVMVVEDESAVRAAAVAMLEEAGYRCIEAPNADEALAMLKQDAQVDLLFTDVVMPGAVKTRDFVAQAQAMRPGLPVLYTSGYTENAIVHHGRLDEGVSLLSKPYAKDDLARRVAQMLRANRPVVLVVEDEPLVLEAAIDMIESLGFATHGADTARAALEILRTPGRIDILFTDMGLPDRNGVDLAMEARAMRPDLKVVFASGYADQPGADAIADAMRLEKPYDRGALAQVLAAAAGRIATS